MPRGDMGGNVLFTDRAHGLRCQMNFGKVPLLVSASATLRFLYPHSGGSVLCTDRMHGLCCQMHVGKVDLWSTHIAPVITRSH